MILTITGTFNVQHPSFQDEFQRLQADANILITEWSIISGFASSNFHIKFSRDFTLNPLARRLGATWDDADIDAFLESIEALESCQVTSIDRKVRLDHHPIGGFPSRLDFRLQRHELTSVPDIGVGHPIPVSSDENEPREGQRVHQDQFEDGDFSEVEIERKDVPIEEVLAQIDKTLEENEK